MIGQPLRILIADDQTLVRGAFRALIDSAPDLHVVAEAATGTQAVELTQQHKPDVALMDIRMPGLDGIHATRQITASPGTVHVRILILTTFDIDQYVYAALRAGAAGFLLKDTRPTDLLDAIRTVAAGEALLAPSVTRRMIEEFTRRPEPARQPHSRLDLISGREQEVLALIGRGLSNTEIAGQLYLSAATVKTHVSRLLTKLSARDRAQLVIVAYETRLVQPLDRPASAGS